MNGTRRGQRAAALDAAVAAIGAVALSVFASIVWIGLQHYAGGEVLSAAAVGWLAVSTSLWWLRKHRPMAHLEQAKPRPPSG